jgi:hypothetical protein
MIREYEAVRFSLQALGEPHWMNKSQLPKMGRLLCFRTSSSVDSGFLVIRFCPRSWMPFQ